MKIYEFNLQGRKGSSPFSALRNKQAHKNIYPMCIYIKKQKYSYTTYIYIDLYIYIYIYKTLLEFEQSNHVNSQSPPWLGTFNSVNLEVTGSSSLNFRAMRSTSLSLASGYDGWVVPKSVWEEFLKNMVLSVLS